MMVRSTLPEQHGAPIRMAEVLAALSLATDLGTGKPMGHAMRACYLGMQMACELRLSTDEKVELYYSFLLMHSGCTVLSLDLAPFIQGDELAAIADATLRDDANFLNMLDWMWKHVSPGALLPRRTLNIIRMLLHSSSGGESLRGTCEVAFRVAQRLGMPPGVQQAVRYYQERWDGQGPNRLAGSDIPLVARLLHLALKVEAVSKARGRDAAETMTLDYKGKIFDPQMVDVFLLCARSANLWQTLAKQDLWQEVLALEPDSPYQNMDLERLDNIALTVADFVDLKSPATMGHSRATARIAEGIARRMGLSPVEVTNIRRAALVHDLGHIALPGYILLHTGPASEADREKLRLHPYYTERVLARVPALAEVAAIAGRHHERVNGSGYYRGLSGSELPVSACVLALADEFQDRMQAQPGQTRQDPKEILKAMQPEAGVLFSAECFEALAQELGVAASKPARRRDWPAGLTGREVEVLRLLATGASNRQIAQMLVVSEKTIAHHLEHIYNKIGISSRAAAVFFAMENDLIS